jgi:hypothetical protein
MRSAGGLIGLETLEASAGKPFATAGRGIHGRDGRMPGQRGKKRNREIFLRKTGKAIKHKSGNQ